jgi:hypothetical protein
VSDDLRRGDSPRRTHAVRSIVRVRRKCVVVRTVSAKSSCERGMSAPIRWHESC